MHISISKVNFTSIGINIAKVDFGMYDSGGEPQLNGLYITPADNSAISVTPNNSYYTLHGKYLKYSFNGKKWKDWNVSVTIEPEQKMYLKGEDDYVWNESTNGKLITSNGYYNVGGDISSLTNFITEVKNETFRFLFEDDSYIKDASNLILPATTLANSCYGSMFHGCTSLTTAPALHATTLAESCYSNMFNGCTSLTTAPELPAATLTQYCYYYMFNGCTALTTAPELPATTLAEACYSYMFNGCTSLNTAPELTATTLTTFCYANMFKGCTSLNTAPELPATTLSYNCYYYMFEGCTSLTTAPELTATKLLDNCYRGMFSGCSKLNNITMLSTDISAVNCLSNWVNGVAPTGTFTKAASMTALPTGINGIPEGWTVKDYGAVDYSSEYMTLSALGDGEITITIPAAINSTYATSLSYSKDKSTWNETIIDDSAQTISIPVTSGENVYLKGIAKHLGNSSTGVNINSTANINASGNTMSLLYGDDYKDKVAFPSGSLNTFYILFRNNTNLINADNLILPAATLAYGCYSSMFSGCTSLTAAPELPATTLADWCYTDMFYGCSSLTAAPALPATTQSYLCYGEMFQGCTSLTTAPELPATTLESRCYESMFYGCTSLTTAPELPATNLTNQCYYNMFYGCSSLITAPELHATKLATYCYYYMFYGCSSLTTAPELPATILVDWCYASMFSGCTSLTAAPELPATTLASYCYQDMFRNCSSINSITMLATDISASKCLNSWVSGVSSTGTFTKAAEMTALPTGINGIPKGWTVADYTDYMTLSALGDGEITITIPAAINSSYATSLSYSKDKSTWNETLIDDTAQTISIPVTNGENVYLKGIAKQLSNGNSNYVNINSTTNINASGNTMSLLYGDDYKDKVAFPEGSKYTFNRLFKDNKHLISAEDLILPATVLPDYCYIYMFYGCSSLTTSPKLPATTLAPGCYLYMFYECKSLTTAPELPATELSGSCYSSMFYDCTSLTNAPTLPATTLANYCYSSMFEFCTSLTTAPELPATTLNEQCYTRMFYRCTALTTANEINATTLADHCCWNMFADCTSLTTSPELHATKLAKGCYEQMFIGCSKLNSITMLATDISAVNCLSNWVNGVAPTGTFTKAAEMTTLPTGVNGIPEGWTVVDYGAQPTFYGIRGTANVTSTTLSNAISFNDTNYDVNVDENGKWEIEYNDPIYTSSDTKSLCNSNNITSIDFRNTIWATRSQTNKDTFGNLFFNGAVSNLKDVYFDFTGQDTNNMCLDSGIFSALTNCSIHGFGTLNWSGEIDVSNTTSKHTFSLREFNRNGIIGTLDLRGIDTTSITDQDVSSIHNTALSFDWNYGYWYLFPNNVHCDTIIIGSLEIQTNYFTRWNGPASYCKTLYCTSQTPPSLSRTGAHGLTCYNWLNNLSNLQNIYVPVGCLDTYKNDPDWSAKSSIMSEKEAPDPLSI